MRFYLTGIDVDKREIYMTSQEDESLVVTIDASAEAWSGSEDDIEVLNAPNGATVYYTDVDGSRTYKNYLFSEEGAKIV